MIAARIDAKESIQAPFARASARVQKPEPFNLPETPPQKASKADAAKAPAKPEPKSAEPKPETDKPKESEAQKPDETASDTEKPDAPEVASPKETPDPSEEQQSTDTKGDKSAATLPLPAVDLAVKAVQDQPPVQMQPVILQAAGQASSEETEENAAALAAVSLDEEKPPESAVPAKKTSAQPLLSDKVKAAAQDKAESALTAQQDETNHEAGARPLSDSHPENHKSDKAKLVSLMEAIKPETVEKPALPPAPVLQPQPVAQPLPQPAAPPVLQPQAVEPQAPVVVSQVPISAVPIEIGLKSLAGINRFEISLEPKDLGRIDVRLDIDDQGEVKAHLTVDRVDTLALLQRDAKTLERAFEQAGLKTSDQSIDLSLRDQGSSQREQSRDRNEPAFTKQNQLSEPEPAWQERPMQKLAWRSATGIDVRI